MTADARIPVRFVRHAPPHAEAGQVLLLPEPAGMHAEATDDDGHDGAAAGWLAVLRLPGPGVLHQLPHRFCSCCGGRSAQASKLTWLFQARARGEIGYFRGVVAQLPPPQEAALRALLASDLFLCGHFVQAD